MPRRAPRGACTGVMESAYRDLSCTVRPGTRTVRAMLDLALETIATPIGGALCDAPRHSAPVAGVWTRAGFPSPAEDFLDDEIDLHRLLVRNPAATYLYRAQGWSMMLAGICDGDILVVDRSIEPRHGDVVLATWDGQQPVCKVLHVAVDHIELHSRNPHCPNIVLPPDTAVEIFAVVGVARSLRRSGHVRAD